MLLPLMVLCEVKAADANRIQPNGSGREGVRAESCGVLGSRRDPSVAGPARSMVWRWSTELPMHAR
jgi:hypothetical protein